MSEERKQSLLQEKATILAELKRHRKNDPRIEGILATQYEDMGSEIDDDVHEMETAEVDAALVDTLSRRLEDIDAELASLS